MATPYSWHQGTTGVATLWPISTPVLPDEILSSWLVRVALANGCDPMVITGLLWPNWRCWTVDIDRGLSDEQARRLSVASGIEYASLSSAHLLSITQKIRKKNNGRALSPWITTLGTRNRKRRTGLQYCPECLRTDPTPYFRLQWRFAWHTVCDRHRLLLLDRCNNCSAPVALHLLNAADVQVSRCYRCHQELKSSETISGNTSALKLQQRTDALLQGKSASFTGMTIGSSQDWFSLASFTVQLVRRSALGKSLMIEKFMDIIEAPVPRIPRIEHGIDFESMSTGSRHEILCSAWPLLGATRKQLHNALSLSSMSRQALIPSGQPVPALLQEFFDELPDKSTPRSLKATLVPRGPRPKRSVLASMAALERRLLKRKQ